METKTHNIIIDSMAQCAVLGACAFMRLLWLVTNRVEKSALCTGKEVTMNCACNNH